MFTRIANWFDDRTGYRRLVTVYRARVVPGGPRWRYVTGSCLLWMLVVVGLTGLLLMTTYSPSSTNAWASVHYIEQMAGGSFMRGVHYWGGQALLVLLALHTIRVLLEGVYRAPRELVWATGLLLLPITLFWAITGNPLPWTQRGFGQIQVETNIIASTPVVGPLVQRVLIGGDDLGHLTLTHLYVLHVAVFPLLVFGLLGLHVMQVFRHGTAVSSRLAADPVLPYWPHQSVRNMAAFSVSLVAVSILAIVKGAPLDAPADATLPSSPRPEWYFLFLFELRRYFSGDWEIVATLVIPLAVLVVLLIMPAIDRRLPRRLGVAFRVMSVSGGVVGWGVLTYVAVVRDWRDPEFQLAAASAEKLAARARELAEPGGIPPEGAIALLRDDAETRGPMLFADNCAACHRLGDEFRIGDEAPDLAEFASEAWIRELLRDPGNPRFFGRTKLTRMKKWVEENLKDLEPAERAEIDRAAKWLATKPRGMPADDDHSEFAQGFAAFSTWCIDCHKYEGEGGTDIAGPDFTGYGSAEWVRDMLVAPNSAERYGQRSAMPAFAEKLSDRELDMLVNWLTEPRDRSMVVEHGTEGEIARWIERVRNRLRSLTNPAARRNNTDRREEHALDVGSVSP
jgi:ubiquinol-cytochrome c reductase cytochrome b subunit